MEDDFRHWPLKDIHTPHLHDVLCGRGGGSNSHVGNMHWRMLVAANKELYVTLPKKQKLLLSMSIVNAVRSQKPPGRFLQKDAKSDLYYDVGDQRAQEKTSQALREGAPDIKKKIAHPTSEINTAPLQTPIRAPPPAIYPHHARAADPLAYPAAVQVPLPPPVPAQGPVRSRSKKKSTLPEQPTISMHDSMPEHYSERAFNGNDQNNPQQVYDSSAGDDYGSARVGLEAQKHELQQQQYAMSTGPLIPSPVDGGLEPSALSFGTYMSMGTIETNLTASNHYDDNQQQHNQDEEHQHIHAGPDNDLEAVAPVDGGLESFQGVSFGTAVMSVDTLQLERAGLSVGSVMSLNTMPAAVDGGLDAIGASFGSMSISRDVPNAVDGGLQSVCLSIGSLSLSAEDRAFLINSLREDNIEIPAVLESMPTFLSAQKSRGNLLECSDTDSDEESRKASSAHPSADWEKLQATLAAQNTSLLSQSSSSMVVPPPSFPTGPNNPTFFANNNFAFLGDNNEYYVPTTGFDRDLSALSVGDFEPAYGQSPATERDRQAMPPPANRNINTASDTQVPRPPTQLRKADSDHWGEV